MTFTDGQRKAKQRFWRRIKAQGTNADPTKLTNIQIARLAGAQKLTTYLGDPLFHDWFLNERAEEDLIKSGAEGAIKCLMDIISGAQEVKSATAQVTAAKILLDMAGYGAQQKKEIVYKDAEIGKMTEDELKDYIQRQAERLN
jgi:hypothetical protein